MCLRLRTSGNALSGRRRQLEWYASTSAPQWHQPVMHLCRSESGQAVSACSSSSKRHWHGQMHSPPLISCLQPARGMLANDSFCPAAPRSPFAGFCSSPETPQLRFADSDSPAPGHSPWHSPIVPWGPCSQAHQLPHTPSKALCTPPAPPAVHMRSGAFLPLSIPACFDH